MPVRIEKLNPKDWIVSYTEGMTDELNVYFDSEATMQSAVYTPAEPNFYWAINPVTNEVQGFMIRGFKESADRAELRTISDGSANADES